TKGLQVVIRGVDYFIGRRAHRSEQGPFPANSDGGALERGQGMAAAGFRIAAEEDVVTCLGKNDAKPDLALPQNQEMLFEVSHEVPVASVHDERQFGDVAQRLAASQQVEKSGQEGAGKVVDGEVAQVLQDIEGGRLSCPGETGEEQEIR